MPGGIGASNLKAPPIPKSAGTGTSSGASTVATGMGAPSGGMGMASGGMGMAAGGVGMATAGAGMGMGAGSGGMGNPTPVPVPKSITTPTPQPQQSGGGLFSNILHGVGNAIGDVAHHVSGAFEGMEDLQPNNPAIPNWLKLTMGGVQGALNPTKADQAAKNAVQSVNQSIDATKQPGWLKGVEKTGFGMVHDTFNNPLTYADEPLSVASKVLGVTKGVNALKNAAKAGVDAAAKSSPKVAKVVDATSKGTDVVKNAFKTLPGARQYFKTAVSKNAGEIQSGLNKAQTELEKTIFKGTTPEQRTALTHAMEPNAPGTKLADPKLDELRQKVEAYKQNLTDLAQKHGIVEELLNPEEMGVGQHISHVMVDKLDENGAPIIDNAKYRTTVDAAKNRGIAGTIKQINDENGKKVFEDDMLKILGHQSKQLYTAIANKKLINTAMEHGIDPNDTEALKALGLGSVKSGVKVPLVTDAAKQYAANYSPDELKTIRTGLEQQHSELMNQLTPKDVQGHAKLLRDLALTKSGADLLKSVRQAGGIKMTPGHDVYRDYVESVPIGVRLSVGSKTGRPLDEVANHLNMDANTLLSHLSNAQTGTSKKVGDYLEQAAHELGYHEHQQDIQDLEKEMSSVNNAMDHLKGPSEKVQISTADLHPETKTPMSYFEHNGKTVLLPKAEADYLNKVKTASGENNLTKISRVATNAINKTMFAGNPFFHPVVNLLPQTIMHAPNALLNIAKSFPEAFRGVQPGSDMDKALQSGAMNLASHIGRQSTPEFVNNMVRAVDNKPGLKSVPGKIVHAWNSFTPKSEMAFRSGLFKTLTDNGMNAEDAANKIRGIYGGHIAPGVSSDAEKAASFLMPFINWTKTSIGSNVANALKHPAGYVGLYNGLNSINEQNSGHNIFQNPNPISLAVGKAPNGRTEYASLPGAIFDAPKLISEMVKEGPIHGVADFAEARSTPWLKYLDQVRTGEQNPSAPVAQKYNVVPYPYNPANAEINKVPVPIPFTNKTVGMNPYAAQAVQDVGIPGESLMPQKGQPIVPGMIARLFGSNLSTPNPNSALKEQQYAQRMQKSEQKSAAKKKAQGG